MATDPQRHIDLEQSVELVLELGPYDEELMDEAAQRTAEAETEQKTMMGGAPERKRLKARLFGLGNTSRRSTINFAAATSRSYNYEEIYDEDEYGKETFPEARVWRVHNDETQIIDQERIDAWRDTLDVLLVIIGLFSAIVTTFVVQTSQALAPNHSQMAVIATLEILRLMNSTIPKSALYGEVTDFQFGRATPSTNDVVVNALWFTSLAISLSTALLAILTKQWLHHYMTSTSGTSRERARIRQFRYAGLERYQVPLIIDILTLLLHFSLAIFLAGLAVFLRPLHDVMFALVVGISSTAYLLYLVSIIFPLFDPQCPYKSPLSFYCYHIYLYLATAPAATYRGLRSASRSATPWSRKAFWGVRESVSRAPTESIERLRHLAMKVHGRFTEGYMHGLSRAASIVQALQQTTEAQTPARTLNAAETVTVRRAWAQLDVDALVWLYNASANSAVRTIALEAFGGLQLSDANTDAAIQIVESNLYPALRQLSIPTEKHPMPLPGFERQHDRLLRALCVGDRVKVERPFNLWMKDFRDDEQDPTRAFGLRVLPWFEISWARYGHSLEMFFPPGLQSGIAFPLPVWAAVIRLAKLHIPDHPAIRAGLMAALHLPVDVSNMGAIGLEVATQNPHIRSLAMEYLGILGHTPEHILSFFREYISLLLFEENGSSVRDATWIFLHSSPSTLPSLFSSFFKSLAGQTERLKLSDKENAVMHTILDEFLQSSYANQVSWETIYHVTQAWNHRQNNTIRAITSPAMIENILAQFCRRGHPKEEDVEWIKVAVGKLEWILFWCLDSVSYELAESIFNSMCALDMLPPDIESMSENTCLRHFWSQRMCGRIMLQALNLQQSQQGKRWFDAWVEYNHTQKRLMFLCRQIIPIVGKAWKPHPLAALCHLEPSSPLWPSCFRELLTHFSGGGTIDPMLDQDGDEIKQPRRHLSIQLKEMKSILDEYHKLPFDIPQYDKNDNPILSTSGYAELDTQPGAGAEVANMFLPLLAQERLNVPPELDPGPGVAINGPVGGGTIPEDRHMVVDMKLPK